MPLGSRWVTAVSQTLKLHSKGGGEALGVGITLGGSRAGSEEAMVLALGLV